MSLTANPSQSRIIKLKTLPLFAKAAAIFGILFLCFLARGFYMATYMRLYYIPAGSMENTLQINDRVFVDEHAYQTSAPRDGDIVIFTAPQKALEGMAVKGSVNFIKRVVGTPSETIEIKRGTLYRNGKVANEPYIHVDGPLYDMKIVGGKIYSREYRGGVPDPWSLDMVLLAEMDEIKIQQAKSGKVPANSYIMLGDHRNNSNDSHVWGFAPRSSIIGRATSIFSPWDRRRSLG